MGYCSVRWCGKSSRTSSYKRDGITFHRFPKSPAMKSKWIDATHRGESWFPTSTSVICSRHFTADCFHALKNHRRRLLNSAVPTLYLPILAPFPSDVDNAVESEQDIKPTVTDLRQESANYGAGTSEKKDHDSGDDAVESEQDIKPTVADLIQESANYGAGTSEKKDHDSADDAVESEQDIKPTVADLMQESANYGAGTSEKKDPDSNLQDSMLITTSQAPGRKRKLPCVADPLSLCVCADDHHAPSASITIVNKRLCRRVAELEGVVKQKNLVLRRIRDSNRKLKRQIIKLKSLLTERDPTDNG